MKKVLVTAGLSNLGRAIRKEFEDNGYKVSIEDNGNGYYVDFIMRFSWNDKVVKFDSKSFGHNKLLYTTDNEIITG